MASGYVSVLILLKVLTTIHGDDGANHHSIRRHNRDPNRRHASNVHQLRC
jgi:hypothetical protein